MTIDELIEEILFCLPIKSLVRCKLLSKTWCHRIQERLLQSEPQFLGFFFTDNTSEKVRFSSVSVEGTKLLSKDETWGSSSHTDIHILTSSNGFLLCSWEKEHPVDYIIYNPITEQYATLSKPEGEFDSESNLVSHLLICNPSDCYSPMEKVKYKVIRILLQKPGNRNETKTVVRVEIFSSCGSSTAGWKVLHLTCQSRFNYRGFCDKHFLGNIPVLLREEGEETVFYFPVHANGNFMIDHVAVFYTREKHIELFKLPPHCLSCCFGFGQSEGNVLYVACNSDYFEILSLDEMRAEWDAKQKITSTPIPLLLPGCRIFSVMGVHPTNPKLILVFLCSTSELAIYDAEASTISIVFKFNLPFEDPNLAVFYVWPHWPPVFH